MQTDKDAKNKQADCKDGAKLPKILILGGGYGGLKVALGLQRILPQGKAEITMVSKHDYHYQTTLLHKVAIGTLSARKARIYYRKILDLNKVTFIKDKVVEICPEEKHIICRRSGYSYDYLVIGLGFKPETYGIEGVDKYAYKLSSLNAALRLTKNIENKFKDFVLHQDEKDLRVIVCGTGFTGIEFAAELATQLDDLCQISGISRNIPKVTCIGRSAQILPMFNEEIVNVAKHKLAKLGVELITNAEVIECKSDGVTIKKKIPKSTPNTESKDKDSQNTEFDTITQEIKGNTILWSVGVRGNDIVEKSSIPNKRGRIPVDSQLRCPQYPEIFVVGDCAIATARDIIHAPTAQLSAQMGDYVAEVLSRIILGKETNKTFAFKHRGTVCSIGHTDGIGVVYGKDVAGELAAFMKNTIENKWLLSIGGLRMVYRKGQFRYRTSN